VPEKAHPPATVLTEAQALKHLRRANAVAQAAAQKGRHPFGAVLVAADGETVLLEQGNVDGVNHAEAVLARVAAHRFDTTTLWGCTLVTTVEPCAMCAATQYWAHIGALVFGLSETSLLEITGAHPDNPTLNLPCRTLFAAGQKPIHVQGPMQTAQDDIAAVHRSFWHKPVA
jgi:tRNA(Arg) A34 adenosine deaminase TadA